MNKITPETARKLVAKIRQAVADRTIANWDLNALPKQLESVRPFLPDVEYDALLDSVVNSDPTPVTVT